MNRKFITTLSFVISLLIVGTQNSSQGKLETMQVQASEDSATEAVKQTIPTSGGVLRTPGGASFIIREDALKQDTEVTLTSFSKSHPKTDPRVQLIGPLVQVEIPLSALELIPKEMFYLYSPSNEEEHKRSDLTVEVRAHLDDGRDILYLTNYRGPDVATKITRAMLEGAYLGKYPETIIVSAQPVDMKKIIENSR